MENQLDVEADGEIIVDLYVDDQDRMYVFALQSGAGYEKQMVLRMVTSVSESVEPAVVLLDDIVFPHYPSVSVGASGLVALLRSSETNTRVIARREASS